MDFSSCWAMPLAQVIEILYDIFTPKMKERPQFTLLVLNSLHKPLDQLCDQREIQKTVFLIFLDSQILPKNIFPPTTTMRPDFCHIPKMIISIHPQHPTPAGAHSLPQGGGSQAGIFPWIWQREEGLHVPRTKQAQHHSFSTLLYLEQSSQRQLPPGQLSCEGFPKLMPWEWQGAFRAAHRRQPAPCSP